MIIRDFYFAAWAIEKGIGYSIANGKVKLDIDATTLNKLKVEYSSTDKPKFDRVKSIIRLVNASR
jgi:hypothetical protein